MPEPYRVAVLGFSAFERSAITSYFGLNPRRWPAYELVTDVDEARIVVADADQPGVAALLRTLGRVSHAVFIGDHAPADAGAWMMRPISPAHLLREMDALLVQLDNPGSGPLPLSLPGALSPLRTEPQGLGAPARRAADLSPGADADSNRRGLAEARRRLQAAVRTPPPSAPPRRALLVDDSEIALLFLRRQLARYGLDTDFARQADDALDLLSRQPYAMVFVDLDLGEDSSIDGLMLCQQIRHRTTLAGPQPLVAMVSAFHDPVDQVRGTLAGADAYLGKPLDFRALDRLMVGQGLKAQGAPPPA